MAAVYQLGSIRANVRRVLSCYKKYGGMMYSIREPVSINSHSVQTAKLLSKWDKDLDEYEELLVRLLVKDIPRR